MKKIAMKDGRPKFILDTEDLDYQMYINLLEKHHDYQICDVKDVNDVTFYHNCNAYFDPDGEYETKDGRLFHLDYDLGIINARNEKVPISREITKQSYDGKDGIHFTLPICNTSLEEMINTAMDSLHLLYPEEKPVGTVEPEYIPEYIYAIYSCRTDGNGDKHMTLSYYTKDINAFQELIYLENKFHELFSNGKAKEEWYDVSEIDVGANRILVEFVKSTAKEITLEDVKNIKLRVTAYITTGEPNKCDRKWFSSMFNKQLYISLYPNQPKVKVGEEVKLNNIEHTDATGFLHISHSFIVSLDNVEETKQSIYRIMIRKAVKMLSKNLHNNINDYCLFKILNQFDNF